MFDPDRLQRAVALQSQSYTLLQWINTALKSGTLSFSFIHGPISFSDAAAEWIARNLKSLPEAARPSPADLPAFARLFSSYLTTSFEVVDKATVSNGCWCAYCSYILSATHLRARNPTSKARREAIELKRIYLKALAAEQNCAAPETLAQRMLDAPELVRDLALATYGQELLRRTEFASQGEGVLVLWREFSRHTDGKLNRKFQLRADDILAAEARLIATLPAG